ncbi:MAG: hypothetical protein EAX90_08235 [Candidatus Heimdallarchaeota archaeon]|nr:hypothetical protein [Candidatus Heimdallarchaeota archaeon]
MKLRIVFSRKLILIIFTCLFLFSNIILVNSATTKIKFTIYEIGSIKTNGEAMNVVVEDEIAFVLDTADNNPEGVVIINVSNPSYPVKLSSFFDGGIAYEIAIKGDYAIVADGTDGIEILNISNLKNPSKIFQYPVNNYCTDVVIIEDLLYAANWDKGLEIFNISDISNPVKINSYNSFSLNCMQLDIEGEIAVVTNHQNDYTSIIALNISNPYSPIQLANYVRSGVDFWDPVIHEGYIYVCNHGLNGGELQILDMSDPTNITQIGIFDDRANIHATTLNNSIAFLADYNLGVEIIDVSDPTNPVKIGKYFDGGHAKNLRVVNDLIFVADREDGLEILRIVITTKTADSNEITIVIITIGAIFLITQKVDWKTKCLKMRHRKLRN